MSDLLRSFVSVGWEIGTFVVFVLGCAIGFFLGRWLKKQWPPEYQDLVATIDGLAEELTKTDRVVLELWTRARFRIDARQIATEFETRVDGGSESSQLIHPLTLRMLNLQNRLRTMREDLKSVAPGLKASDGQVSKPTKSQRDNQRAKIPIGRRDPDDSTSDYAGSVRDEFNLTEADVVVDSVPQVTPTSQYDSPLMTQIVALYNRAVTDALCREEFRERFQPVRIATTNAVERSQNPTIQAEFRETTDGNLFAFPVFGDQYAVLPRLGLTIESVSYGAGALGEVFSKTQGHDPKLFYSQYRVLEAALFKKLSDDYWELQSPGELDLGPGD